MANVHIALVAALLCAPMQAYRVISSDDEKSMVCPTPPANLPITDTWSFMNDVEKDPHTIFHIYGDPMAETNKRQFLVMAAMPGNSGSGQYRVEMAGKDGQRKEYWGMTYFVVKGAGCTRYTKKDCKVDRGLFGNTHADGDNTPSRVGWMGFFGTGWGRKTNEYTIPSAAGLGRATIALEPCQYDPSRVCALVRGTSCYLKRVHVCELDGGTPKSFRMEGLSKDGEEACTVAH
eukprot:CAMPEP_0204596852 /NCGR_PEP_ID=MMETSP0661-20131031/53472_1 /ASSEMBLY_ACC=CAM_ASM_000606 /TAXON_ID=109239 /ORGANISM="Alexandrium margalefi, Strain AMGDE01CS-322" /LENGTH=232 /DNA_ID=CAMNT_0051607505 /DNA_START=85 /DNA_END=783 /DNA_ORIENTATION=+